jgi:hypothetical protein
MNVMPAADTQREGIQGVGANTKEKEVVVNLFARIDLGSKGSHSIFVWKQDD